MLLRELIIDASALINLIPSAITHDCLGSIQPRACVTPVVREECCDKESTEQWLLSLLDSGHLEEMAAGITADELIEFMEIHGLGAGESEGILTCLAIGRHFWSDDKRARNVARVLLAQGGVIGTAGILRDLVGLEIIAAPRAYKEYQTMRAAGGFLPDFALGFFEGEPAG